MTRKYRFLLFAILSIFVLCFIFSNSMESKAESSAKSSGIAAFLRPVLDPFGWMTDDQFHHFIRKLAHFTEFAALGFCLTGAAVNTLWTGKKVWLRPILWSAMTAVTDETIQLFTGRACMVRDMLLDTCGAVAGVLVVYGMIWIWGKRRKSE